MKEDTSKWIDQVLQTTESLERAKPAAELLSRIEAQIFEPKIKRIPLNWIRGAAAAVLILVSINIWSAISYSATTKTEYSDNSNSSDSQWQLSSTYNLYEQ